MKSRAMKKVLSLLVVFTLIFQQTGFAQGLGQLDIAKYIGAFSGPQQFRPLLLRYFSYDPLTDNFQLLLDKGNLKKIEDSQLKEQGQELLKYFLVGVALPDDNFWVNLRPDSEEQIINEELVRTDLGKVLLEADLQLKKDVAKFTSPETPEGREYWNQLYEKAGQIFSSENITIPTLTRPWIVPGEVIIRETANSAYVYKATLKVMLEQDHLKNSADYNFSDPRLKELNEYSSQIIREKIIPKLTKEVNSSARYAALRQVFFSLILSRWFKHKFAGQKGLSPQGTVPVYVNLINTGNLNGLVSQNTWSKTIYFEEYKKSFAQGEYNLEEQINTAMGPTIRTYFSGGVDATARALSVAGLVPGSLVGTYQGKNPNVIGAIGKGMAVGSGSGANGELDIAGASSPIININERIKELERDIAERQHHITEIQADTTNNAKDIEELRRRLSDPAISSFSSVRDDIQELEKQKENNLAAILRIREHIWEMSSELRGLREKVAGGASSPISAEQIREGLQQMFGVTSMQQELSPQLTEPFISGQLPPDINAFLSSDVNFSVLVTQLSAAVGKREGRIGIAKTLIDKTEIGKAKIAFDLRTQEIQDMIAKLMGYILDHYAFETKGEVEGGHEAGAKSGDLDNPDAKVTPIVSDTLEGTTISVEGRRGASSLQIAGPGAAVFGRFIDEARALMVVTNINPNPELEERLLREWGVASIEKALDPQLEVNELVRRIAQLNGLDPADLSNTHVTVLTGDKSDINALKTLQQETGLKFEEITEGTVQPSIAAALGVKNGGTRIFLRRSGMTEALFVTLFVALFSEYGALSLFKVVSPNIKQGNEQWNNWPDDEKSKKLATRMRESRKAEEVTFEDMLTGRPIFSSRDPRLRLPEFSMWGAYTFVTDGRTDQGLPFNVLGAQQEDSISAVHTLAFVSNPDAPGKGFLVPLRGSYTIQASSPLEADGAQLNTKVSVLGSGGIYLALPGSAAASSPVEVQTHLEDYVERRHSRGYALQKLIETGLSPEKAEELVAGADGQGIPLARSVTKRLPPYTKSSLLSLYKRFKASRGLVFEELVKLGMSPEAAELTLQQAEFVAASSPVKRRKLVDGTGTARQEFLDLLGDLSYDLREIPGGVNVVRFISAEPSQAREIEVRVPAGGWPRNSQSIVRELEQRAREAGISVTLGGYGGEIYGVDQKTFDEAQTRFRSITSGRPTASSPMEEEPRIEETSPGFVGSFRIERDPKTGSLYFEHERFRHSTDSEDDFISGKDTFRLDATPRNTVLRYQIHDDRASGDTDDIRETQLEGQHIISISSRQESSKETLEIIVTPELFEAARQNGINILTDATGHTSARAFHDTTPKRWIQLISGRKDGRADASSAISLQEIKSFVEGLKWTVQIGNEKTTHTLHVLYGDPEKDRMMKMWLGGGTKDTAYHTDRLGADNGVRHFFVFSDRVSPLVAIGWIYNQLTYLETHARLPLDKETKSAIINKLDELKKAAASSPLEDQSSVSGIDASLRSASRPETGNLGGIDFRVIPMITQPMGNLSGLSFSLPQLSNLESINLDEEFSQIQNMLQAGITPSGDRLKEYVAACYQKGELKEHLEGIIASLVDICKLEEEKVDVTSDATKEVLLILDSIS